MDKEKQKTRLIDLSGKRFGKLVVIERVGTDRNHRPTWKCICDCGAEKVIDGSSLRSGLTVSCGCYGKEQRLKSHITHRKTNTRLFNVWQNIKRRCYTKTNPSYKYYGERGIKVCKEWLDSFEAFREWAYANGYDENAPKGKCTIDRIDVNGNYEPSNCRWITQSENAKKRQQEGKIQVIEYGGESHGLREWSLITGINQTTLQSRIRSGWSIERALTEGVHK